MKKILLIAGLIAYSYAIDAYALDLIYQNSLDSGKLYFRSADSTFTGGISLGVSGSFPSYSPSGDGKFIYRNSSDNKLYTRGLNESGTGTVFSNIASLTDPSYSSGGDGVFYANLSDGRIYLAKPDGSIPTVITPSGSSNLYPKPSPDGNKLMYMSGGTSTWVKNPNDSLAGTLLRSGATYASFSPDGSQVVYVNQSDSNKIYIKSAYDTSTGSAVTSISGLYPVYSTDGQKIFYKNTSNGSMMIKDSGILDNGTAITANSSVGNGIAIQPVPYGQYATGLVCSTKPYVDISSTVWHGIGDGLPDVIDFTGTGRLAWKYTLSGSLDTYDTVSYQLENEPVGSSSTLPSDSVKWPPGTSTGYLKGTGYLEVLSYANGGAARSFNIAQIGAVGYTTGTGTATIKILGTDNKVITGTKDWSGPVLTLGIRPDAYGIGFKGLNAFSGIRVGNAPTKQKSSCNAGVIVCQWTVQDDGLHCGPTYGNSGLPIGDCVIAPPASPVAGYCVPKTDSNGNVIPPNPLATGNVIRDANGNIVGAINPELPEDITNTMENIFTCNINDSTDSWYDRIGKALICPFGVASRASTYLWKETAKSYNGVRSIASVGDTLHATSSGSKSTGSTNVLVQTIINKTNTVSDLNSGVTEIKKLYLMGYWMFVVSLLVSIIGGVVFVISKKNG